MKTFNGKKENIVLAKYEFNMSLNVNNRLLFIIKKINYNQLLESTNNKKYILDRLYKFAQLHTRFKMHQKIAKESNNIDRFFLLLKNESNMLLQFYSYKNCIILIYFFYFFVKKCRFNFFL